MNQFKVGVCLFDDPMRMDAGWISINGSPAVRIKTHSDMIQHRNTIFVTNAGWAEFNSTGMFTSSYLRMENYFKTTLSSLANEFDLSTRDSPRPQLVEMLSPILNSSLKYAHGVFDGLRPESRSLGDCMYDKVPKDRIYRPSFDEEEDLVIKSSWQESSLVNRKWESGYTSLRFNPNRVRHAEMILSSPVPFGICTIENVVGQHLRAEDLIELDIPIAIMADIEWTNSSMAELCAVGVSASPGFTPSGMREWFLLPEILMLMPYAKFNIHKVAQWVGWQETYVPEGLFGTEVHKFSIATGLVAESYLNTMMSKKYSKAVKYYTPIGAAWLRSVDRAISFGAAKRLSENGIRISKYSLGAVQCLVMKEEIDQALDIAAECGFFSSCQFGSKIDVSE